MTFVSEDGLLCPAHKVMLSSHNALPIFFYNILPFHNVLSTPSSSHPMYQNAPANFTTWQAPEFNWPHRLPIDWAPWAPISPPPPSGLPGLPTPPISAGLPKLVGLPLLPNRNFEAMGAQLISGAQQILMVLGAQGAREPRTMKCTKASKKKTLFIAFFLATFPYAICVNFATYCTFCVRILQHM